MPDVISAPLLTATGLTGTPTRKFSYSEDEQGTFNSVYVGNTTHICLYARAGTGGTALTFTVEVTTDPAGDGGWATAVTRLPGGAAYASTARTPTTAGMSLFLDPTDNINWVRLNVTTNDTSGPVAYVIAER